MNNEKLEAIAREVRRLTLGYAALHFDGKDRMCNPAYVSEYLRGLMDAPIDVSGLAATFAAQPAEQASAGSIATLNALRRAADDLDDVRKMVEDRVLPSVIKKSLGVMSDAAREAIANAAPTQGE